jgi:hypothetical protein
MDNFVDTEMNYVLLQTAVVFWLAELISVSKELFHCEELRNT